MRLGSALHNWVGRTPHPGVFRKESGIDRLQKTSEIMWCKRVCKLLILKGAENAQERTNAKESASSSREKS